ncbi:MAG: hypothetical protein HDS58_02985 [Barnesiella sp.]|nr:hypothetical protein [Bacteroidales bacterium]MBD5249040.1 hypothetical protein [Barnesiella sp.]
MTGTQIFRFSCLTILWLALCYLVISQSPEITLWTIFVIICSGIVVFVPLYKRYIRNGRKDKK